jgi:hypothetical protein
VVDELSPDSTYYFTIVALDSSGNQTSIAFSSAMPTKLTGAGKTKDTTSTSLDDPVMIGVILIIIILIILLLISIKKR